MSLGHLLGDLEIEERRPRTWNEPRRKRLSFVRPHHKKKKSSSSDEWAVVPANRDPGRRMANDAETWDLRQYEAQRRFIDQDNHRRMLDTEQQRRMWWAQNGPHMHQQQQQQIQHLQEQQRRHEDEQHRRLQQGHQQPRIEHRSPRGAPDHRWGDDDEDPNEIVRVEGSSSDGFSDSDGATPHRIPLSIEKVRDRDHSLPRVITLKPGALKGDKKKRSSSKTKPKHKTSHKTFAFFQESSSDSDSDGSFVEGYIAGRKASLKRGSPSRSPRRPRFEQVWNTDSDDSMDFRRRVGRSRSRGRYH